MKTKLTKRADALAATIADSLNTRHGVHVANVWTREKVLTHYRKDSGALAAIEMESAGFEAALDAAERYVQLGDDTELFLEPANEWLLLIFEG